jgi:hypothetical protein
LDEASGAAALERLRPQLAALAGDRLGPARFNVRLAAAAGLGLCQLVAEQNLRPSLAALAQVKLFDLAHLDGLADLSRALWYVRHRLDQQTALRSRATLPAPLVAAATELRSRMLRVLTFRFDDQPPVAARLDYIRSGTGYQDLADDLFQLAGLYAEHRAGLAGTPAPYDPQDQAHAAKQADQILTHLGLSPELDKSGQRTAVDSASWIDLQRRAALLLGRAYDEVATAARFICRQDEALVGRLAPLASIARSRPSRSGTTDPSDPPAAPADEKT